MRSNLLDLIAPAHCPACGATSPAGTVCPACAPAFHGRAWRVLRPRAPIPPTWAATPYDGPVRATIVAYKERRRRDLAALLGGLLTCACRAGRPPPAVLVPVPARRAAAFRRGDDAVARLAAHAARQTGATVVAALRYRRPVADQSGLDAAARTANLTGALEVSPQRLPSLPRGSPITLVDDVCTTGATLVEAARALRAAGRPPTAAAVVAATVSRSVHDPLRLPPDILSSTG